MSKNKDIFISCFIIIFFQTQLILGKFISTSYSLVLFPFLIAAFYVSAKIIGSKNIWEKQKEILEFVPTKLWGVDIFDDESDIKEKRFLENLKLSVRGKRIFATVASLFVTSVISYNIYSSPFSLAPMLLNFTILTLINSSFVGHYFFILIINVLCALSWASFDRSVTSTQLLLLTFSTIFIFFLYKRYETQFGDLLYEIRSVTFQSLKTFLFFIAIYSIYTLVLPEKLTLFDKKLAIKKLAKKTAFTDKKTAQSIDLKLPPITIPDMDLSHELKDFELKLNEMESQLNNMERVSKSVPNITPEMQVRIDDLQLDIKNLKADIGNLKQGTKDITEVKSFWHKLDQLSDKMNSLDQRFDNYKYDVEKSALEFNSDTSKKLLSDLNKSNLTQQVDQLVKDLELQANKLEESLAPKVKEASAAIKLKQNRENKRAKLKKKEKEEERNWKKIMAKLEKAAKALLAFSIFMMIMLFFKKKKVDTEKTFSKEDAKNILRQFKQIQARKLSANEEIIQSYNVFKEAVKITEFETEEVPPPQILFSYLVDNKRRFQEDTWCVTDLFCECYYGNKNANQKELRSYRHSFAKVLKNLG